MHTEEISSMMCKKRQINGLRRCTEGNQRGFMFRPPLRHDGAFVLPPLFPGRGWGNKDAFCNDGFKYNEGYAP
jgi:hypothetical protein